jgi:hypothetical protein
MYPVRCQALLDDKFPCPSSDLRAFTDEVQLSAFRAFGALAAGR